MREQKAGGRTFDLEVEYDCNDNEKIPQNQIDAVEKILNAPAVMQAKEMEAGGIFDGRNRQVGSLSAGQTTGASGASCRYSRGAKPSRPASSRLGIWFRAWLNCAAESL